MAGFAVDIGDEGSSFAAPVNMPSGGGMTAAAEGLAALGKGVFGMLDEAAKANRQTEGSFKRGILLQASKELDALSGADPLSLRVGVQAVVNNHLNRQGTLDEAFTNLVKFKSGVDVSHLNFDPNQEALNAVNKALEETPGLMVLAQRELAGAGKPFTGEDVYKLAAFKAQSIAADTALLASIDKRNKVQFETRVKPTVTGLVQKLNGLALAALSAETVPGQDLNPQHFLRLFAEIEKGRALSSAGLTGEEKTWVDNQFDILKNLVTTAQSYDQGVLDQKRADVLEPITDALIRQAGETGADPLLARAILDPKLDLSTYVSENYPQFRDSLSKVEPVNITYVDLDFSAFEPAMDQAAQNAKTDPNADPIPNGPDIHAPAELEKAMGFTDIQRRDAFTAATALVNLASVKNMSAPQQRDLFFNGIAQATANLSTSGELFRAGSINSLLNDEVFAKLKEAEKYDPDGARLAKDRLGDALKAQANAALTALSGSTQTSSFKIAGIGKVEIDLSKVGQDGTVFAGVSRDTMALAQGFASKWYDGNVSAMIEDRGRRLNTFDRSQLEAGGWKTNQYAQELIKVKKQTETLRLYSDHMKRLGYPTKFFDEMIIKGVQKASEGGDGLQRGTLKNPWQIMWSDSTDVDEKMFASLDVGDYFINKDGDIEQKVK